MSFLNVQSLYNANNYRKSNTGCNIGSSMSRESERFYCTFASVMFWLVCSVRVLLLLCVSLCLSVSVCVRVCMMCFMFLWAYAWPEIKCIRSFVHSFISCHTDVATTEWTVNLLATWRTESAIHTWHKSNNFRRHEADLALLSTAACRSVPVVVVVMLSFCSSLLLLSSGSSSSVIDTSRRVVWLTVTQIVGEWRAAVAHSQPVETAVCYRRYCRTVTKTFYPFVVDGVPLTCFLAPRIDIPRTIGVTSAWLSTVADGHSGPELNMGHF